MKLSSAVLNKPYKILEVSLSDYQRRRILDLGFRPDETVLPIYRGLFNNPTAFLIKGSIIALRDDIANMIIVGEIDEQNSCFMW